ncbi:MAG: AAA family ATPase [Acidimicrobiia bacterium]
MTQHPDFVEEQAHLDRAYACLERARVDARRLWNISEAGAGGTHQARYERDVIEETVRTRLATLDSADTGALMFGRIDRRTPESPEVIEGFHIGRVAVWSEDQEPVVVDWRAPVAEPFYRATGRNPMGLVRRRHFAVRGRTLLGVEDELFGEGHLGIVGEDGLNGDRHGAMIEGLRGYGTLIAALEESRTGRLGDIVATIQSEQDEIIRSPLAGLLVVQGGPGTGKTVVALHRAAYLLYTHRFPLEGQGVLVVGPNRVFLRYIEHVLPSLGETGVEQVVLSELVPGVEFGASDSPAAAKIKGDVRMASVIAKAARDRQRPLKTDLVVPFGVALLRMTVAESERIVTAAKRRFRRHNGGRKFVENEVFAALAASSRTPLDADVVKERLRHTDDVRGALERMWPVLTPGQLLHDLLGSKPLLKLAAGSKLTDDELRVLYRARRHDVREVVWSEADAPLLDEAFAVLGPKPVKGKIQEEDEIRTYGHIVIDEAQDLTPMQLRMATRRSLNGSMTIVGDIAQATGAHAPNSWDDVLRHLPERTERMVELTVGYRIPGSVMELAEKVLRVAAPTLRPPRPVREGEHRPFFQRVDDVLRLGDAVVDAALASLERVEGGSVGVVVPGSLLDTVVAAFDTRGIDYGQARRTGLDTGITVVPVGLVKGLELDATVVVEPSRITSEENQGLRALYVALTRATKELTVVHAESLPEALG